jgi:histidyl-tRNA synthetase
LPFEQDGISTALRHVAALRKRGIPAELYPDVEARMKKKMKYVDARGIPFVGLLGSKEIANGVVSVKNMTSGDQREMPIEELTDMLTRS